MVLALLIVLGATQWNNVQSADNTPSAVTVHTRLIVELKEQRQQCGRKVRVVLWMRTEN